WKEYRQAVDDAQNRNAWQKFSDFMVHYNVFGGSDQKDLDAQETQERLKATQDAHDQYNQKARAKAWDMSQQVFNVFSTFSGGHGPVFMPPNAVMDPPGHPNFNQPGGGTPGAPGGAPGAPSIAPPNVALSMAGPPAASAAD